MIKLYKNSVLSITEQHHTYKALRAFEFAMKLKELFPLSFINNYHSKITYIAKVLKMDRRTVKYNIERLKTFGFGHFEGQTFRFLSYKTIKKSYARKYKNKYTYEEVTLKTLRLEINFQPLGENLKKQKSQIRYKSWRNSCKIGSNKSYLQDTIKSAPFARPEINDLTFLSQEKVSKLLGYQSKSSGRRRLKELADTKYLSIQNNCSQLTRKEFNDYKLTHMPRLLIKGQGKDATYWYLIANSVEIIRKKTVKLSKVGENGSYYTSSFFSEHW